MDRYKLCVCHGTVSARTSSNTDERPHISQGSEDRDGVWTESEVWLGKEVSVYVHECVCTCMYVCGARMCGMHTSIVCAPVWRAHRCVVRTCVVCAHLCRVRACEHAVCDCIHVCTCA